MAGIAPLLRYSVAALLAALYWLAAGSLCFTITGTDPVDVLVTPHSVSIRLAVLGIMAASIAVFALIGKWRWERTRGNG